MAIHRLAVPATAGRVRAWAAAVAMVALVTAGCGGGDGPGNGAAGADGGAATSTTLGNTGAPSGQLPPGSATCRLVSEAEVGSAIGAPVKSVGAGSKPEGQVCTFALSAQTNPPQTVLVVTATNDQGPSAFDSARKEAGAGAQSVTGIGDRAFNMGGQVVALKGRTLVLVVVGVEQPPSTLSQSARKLAETIVDRV